MENDQSPSKRTTSSANWSNPQKQDLTKALSVISAAQKSFGRDVNVRDMLAYYEMKLSGRFSVEQVLYALGIYTDRKNDIPAPADIIDILNPEPPLISQAEYVAALKYQERNGYPPYSAEKFLIQNYESQQGRIRADHDLRKQEIAALAKTEDLLQIEDSTEENFQ